MTQLKFRNTKIDFMPFDNWRKELHPQISNWSSFLRYKPLAIVYCKSESEIIGLIQFCKQNHIPLRVIGSNHSFSPLIKTNGILLDLSLYNGIINLDPLHHRVTVKAGTTIRQLALALAKQGFALNNQGDIDEQTITGAIGTGTHGTGLSLGNLSTQVDSLRLIDGTGRVRICSDQKNPDFFKAAQISMGTLGIITQVTLNIVPLYYLQVIKQKQSLSGFIKQYPQYLKNYRNLEFFWIPYTDQVQRKTMSYSVPGSYNRITDYFDQLVMENLGLGALIHLSSISAGISKKINKIIASLISYQKKVVPAPYAYPTIRQVKFNEMEYALPLHDWPLVMQEIQQFIEKNQINVAFPIEVRFVAPDDIYLSPMYQRETVTISIHMFHRKHFSTFFHGVEKIFLCYNGRPHWGKIHFLEGNQLQKLYPKWADFQSIRQQLDPDSIFLNSYLKTIF